jgi:hypothetical protein
VLTSQFGLFGFKVWSSSSQDGERLDQHQAMIQTISPKSSRDNETHGFFSRNVIAVFRPRKRIARIQDAAEREVDRLRKPRVPRPKERVVVD